MNHLAREELLDLGLGLRRDESEDLRAHLAECEPCRSEFRRTTSEDARLRQYYSSLAAPERTNLEDRILLGVCSPAPAAAPLPVAAALLLAAGVLWVVVDPLGRADRAAQEPTRQEIQVVEERIRQVSEEIVRLERDLERLEAKNRKLKRRLAEAAQSGGIPNWKEDPVNGGLFRGDPSKKEH